MLVGRSLRTGSLGQQLLSKRLALPVRSPKVSAAVCLSLN
jgi:hypothetical protein